MSNLAIKNNSSRVEIVVRGTVQGVGFRPFIYKIASRFEISGDVCNTGEGVYINASAPNDRLDLFKDAIVNEAPPLAKIHSIVSKALDDPPVATDFSTQDFRIIPSSSQAAAVTTIPPDISLCEDCRSELNDPSDRRFGYPFTNCTNCGPRFTIVETIPYDRPKTSMKYFTMCDACEKEYNDPGNRRFHAQPNGCQECGPQVWLCDCDGRPLDTQSPIATAINAVCEGEVLAVRGLGGFHLCVDGCSKNGISRLRSRKIRPDKPLAIMVKDLESARNLCHVTMEEAELLLSPEHPIVLLKRKPETTLAPNLAPGIGEIGVMLPYTPLHHLFFSQENCPEALVMTSGNVSGTPICTANDDALEKLGSIADKFLLHDREILTRVDDSVVKTAGKRPMILRRARGYVPAPVRVRWELPRILGCGAGLKNTFSLGRGRDIFPSQHIGDLDNLESYDFYVESIEHLKAVYQLEPEAVVCDLHPDYPSSRYGAETGLPLYRVQHHHAHGVSVMAEHNLTGQALAIILDGTGLGDDGTIWGGEILQISLTDYKRFGHLSHLHLPGGDAAAVEPWRMGLSALLSTRDNPEERILATEALPPTLQHLDKHEVQVIESMINGGFNSPLTSSCGRLFDSVASLLGVRQRISYEGQAAMELEALARKAADINWVDSLGPATFAEHPDVLHRRNGMWEISSLECVDMVLKGIGKNEDPGAIALRFHTMLISAFSRLIEILAEQTLIRQVVLSGGCMQNSLLLEGFHHTLEKADIRVFTGNKLPVNDGGISIGQTIIGGLRHVSCNPNEGHRRTG